jgi:RNA-directed DNA polymerase
MGARPGRSCHDAIEKIYGLARPNKTKKWVLDADIKGAFDHISHDYLLKAIGPVPGNGRCFTQRSVERRRVE